MRLAGVLALAATCAVLSGCATDAYYRAAEADLSLRLARFQAQAGDLEKARSLPLVDLSWTDIEGTEHRMVVNQPAPIVQRPQMGRPRSPLATPWDGGYQVFNRTLSAVERLLPWMQGRNDTRDSGNTSYSYQFGDGAYFQQSRDYSPTGLSHDSSATNTTAE